MRLEFIELCGFRGFRDRLRVDLASGFTVITGRNGVGKSTLCDAVEFAVTGEIDKYRIDKAAKESLNDYVWWRGEGQPEAHFVTVGFRDDDGERFAISRTREGGADQPPLLIEEMLCVAGAKPDKALQQLCRTTIIRDEWIAALSLDLSETERFDLVRAALGAIEGPDYAAKAREVVAGAEAARLNLDRAYEDTRARLNQTLVELAETRDIAMKAGDVAAALANLGAGHSSNGDLAGKISEARQTLASGRMRVNAMGELVEVARAIAQRRAELSSPAYQTNLIALRDELTTAESGAGQADVELIAAESRLTTEQAADGMAASLAALVEHGARVGLHDGHCPLCDAARTLPEFEAGLAKARARLKTLGSGVAQARERVALARRAKAVATSRLQEARDRLAETLSAEVALTEREAGLALSLAEFGVDQAGGLDPDRVEAAVARERSRLIDLERSILTLEASQAVERVTELEARVAALREDADAAANHLARAQAAITAAKSLEKAVRRTSAEIIDERLAVISPLLNELYQRLRPHSEWRNIEYSIRGDVKRFLSLKVGANLNPQFVFSSGQRRAAGLAFLLSVHLSRPWCHWRTLVLDDPVQHIDDFRALHLVEVLCALRQSGRQIICAVEDSSLADLLCRRLLSTHDAPGRRYELDLGPDGAAFTARATEIEPMAKGVLSAPVAVSAVG